MQNKDHSDDLLDDVLSSLAVIPKQSSQIQVNEEIPLTDEEIHNTLMQTVLDNIRTNNEMLERTKESYDQIGEAEHADAYASVAKNNAELTKVLVNLLIENKKLKQNKELKTRDLDIREKALILKPGLGNRDEDPKLQQNNTFIITDRDTMFNSLFGSDEQKEKAIAKIKENNEAINV